MCDCTPCSCKLSSMSACALLLVAPPLPDAIGLLTPAGRLELAALTGLPKAPWSSAAKDRLRISLTGLRSVSAASGLELPNTSDRGLSLAAAGEGDGDAEPLRSNTGAGSGVPAVEHTVQIHAP